MLIRAGVRSTVVSCQSAICHVNIVRTLIRSNTSVLLPMNAISYSGYFFPRTQAQGVSSRTSKIYLFLTFILVNFLVWTLQCTKNPFFVNEKNNLKSMNTLANCRVFQLSRAHIHTALFLPICFTGK